MKSITRRTAFLGMLVTLAMLIARSSGLAQC